MEYIRTIKIIIEIDTTKRTIHEEFDNYEDAIEYMKNAPEFD